MARIAGVDLPKGQKGLCCPSLYLRYRPFTRSKEILEATGVDPDTRVRDLTEEEVARIRDFIVAITRSKAICVWKSN